MTAVLGIDLASSRWDAIGSALLQFDDSGWTRCKVGCIRWPAEPLTAGNLAAAVDQFARKHNVAAISLDGPHAWRRGLTTSPHLPGVGRWCEYQVRAPGKTLTYGNSKPKTWLSWIRFCIDTFTELLARPGVVLVNSLAVAKRAHDTDILVLECFPTSVWRCSHLTPLPAKSKSTPSLVRSFSRALAQRFALPATAVTSDHDDLQAVVAALPAAGLLGGPTQPISRGVPARVLPARGGIPRHRVEGIIWDARPRPGVGTLPAAGLGEG